MHADSSLFGRIVAPLRRSVAWKLAIIAIGPVLALGLTMLAARHSDGLRLQSEATYFTAHEELGQVSAVNANLTLVASQLSSYLENRAESAEDEMRGAMANVQMALTNLKASSDAGIREAAATADLAINKLQNTFSSLQKRVVQVGRTSAEGVTDELDKLTEILASMFDGAISTDERFKPLAADFADLRGIELRYRWKRDETLTTRIDFLRSNLLNGLSKVDFDKGQADILRTTLMKQRSVVESWQDSIQLERMQRDDALAHAKQVQNAAIGMRERAEVRQAEARHMNKKADETASFFTMLAGMLSTVISIAMIFLVGRSLGRALSRLATAMRRVASGEAGVEVPYAARLDEIGDMGRALGIFQQSIVERAELASAAEKGAKLRLERGEQIEGAVRSFAASVEAALGQLRSSAVKMREASTTLEGNSDDLAQHAEVAGRSTATASNEVSSVAVAAEQLAKSVDEVSRQAVRSTQVASNAVEQSKQASGMMSGLVAEAARIGDVVELIRSIAVQTNLLALNATIEAARAGDAGRGFAVVASEVKALATQTAKATEDIVERINAIQSSSGYVGTAISEIGSILSEMSGIATSVAAAVEEQSSAIATISDNVNEAARSSAEGAVAIQNAGARVSASRETAGMIAQVAQGVTEESERIEAVVSSFLGDVRAA